MLQAAKFGDPVLGVDLHMVMVPSPAGPVPTPLPHPFVGVVFDPLGAAIGAGIGKALGRGGAVYVNGSPVGNTGTAVRGTEHTPTPPGTAFAPDDIPDNEGTLVTGSKTVSMAGMSGGRLGSMVSSCNYPLNLPTSVCLAVPMGAPVLVGGPDSMDWMAAVTRAIRTKWFSDTLHKLLKPGKRLSKGICFLTGHPVDVVTGEVLTDAVDFELPGPIPIVFERSYYSRDRSEGPLGPAWHHPLDAAVHETEQGLTVRLPDGRESPHEPLGVGASVWDPIDRYSLTRRRRGYRLTFWDGRTYCFEPVKGAAVTHPLVRIVDRCENAIELYYEGGRLAGVRDSVGRSLVFVSGAGRLRAVRLRRRDGTWSDLIRYEYDREGRLAAAFNPKGDALRYEYRGGVLVKETNRNGLSFCFEYDWEDPDGWCIRTWGDGGIYDRRITYDKHMHVTVVDDSRGGRTHYYGNPGGLVDREVDATGRETRYEWHPVQYRKTAEIDGLGNRTEWAYDDRGNTVLERDALGHEMRWRYNELNVPVEKVDAAGNVWRQEYDPRGRLARAVDPLGGVTRVKHDRRGNPISIEDPEGRTLRLRYTEAGELKEVVDREGHVTRYELNDRGQVACIVDALGGETVIRRDACGQPVEVRRSDGSRIRVAYDPEGNAIEQTDALGNVTRSRYAGLNQLVERVDPAGGVVQYTYDTEEDLVGVSNELGEEYRIEVDKAGRVVTERGFDGRVLELRYDKAGRCIEMVNGRKKRTKIERDALGRVVKRVVPRKPVFGDPIPEGHVYEYAHDALGNLVRAKNEACDVVFVRDALGRVVEERLDGHAITSRYDGAGNRVGRRTSLRHETSYDFDGNGNLVGVTFGTGELWGKFDPENLALRAPARGPWRATFMRDALGNETERRLPGGMASRWERCHTGLPCAHRIYHEGLQVGAVGYQWRSAEQLAVLIDTYAGPTRFEHDARGHLVAAVAPDGTVTHRAPDPAGNVYRSPERTDRRYGRGGRLEAVGGIKYLHDEDGQFVEKVLPDGSRWTFEWDHAGQLEAVTRPDGQRITFAYDALGRRVKKTFAGKSIVYVWDGDDLVHELGEDDEEGVTWVFEPGTFAPLAKVEDGRRFGVVTDHLGTPRMLADEVGALAWKAQLDVYGAAKNDVALTGCPWRWPGQYEDEETGLYYNRFRYYDPEMGRYISQDPLGLDAALPLYAYVPDPLCWIDPLGLISCKAGGRKRLRELGLEAAQLANRSFNSGRKALKKAGFVFAEATPTGRQVFINMKTGARVYYDSGKALSGKQRPHWHITDAAGSRYNRSGRVVTSAEEAGHIPAAR